MQRIDELENPPIVGKFYKVPTVRADYFLLNDDAVTSDWPVLTPMHDDWELLGFARFHYHLDLRFILKSQIKALRKKFGYIDWVEKLTISPLQTSNNSKCEVGRWETKVNPDGFPAIQYLPRKCMRNQPTGIWDFLEEDRGYPGLFEKLNTEYQDKKLKPGMICPHKGVCLKSMPVNDDLVRCPAHGLVWNVKTGELVTYAERHGLDDNSQQKAA